MPNKFIKNIEEYTGAEAEIHKISIETTISYKNKIQKCIITIKNDKVKVKPKKSFMRKICKRIRKLHKRIYKWYNSLSDEAEFTIKAIVICIIAVVVVYYLYQTGPIK